MSYPGQANFSYGYIIVTLRSNDADLDDNVKKQ